MKSAILSTAAAGTLNQAIGLADYLGLSPYHWLAPKSYLGLTPGLWRLQMRLFRRSSVMPWEKEEVKLVISCGKHAVMPAVLAKRTKDRLFLCHIQNPKSRHQQFDLIIAPAHDRLRGENVITSRGSLHRISPDLLKREAAKWRLEFARCPKPFTAVLVGGSRRFSIPSASYGGKWGNQLNRWQKKVGGTLLLLPSARTPSRFLTAILARLQPNTWRALVAGPAGNPYLGALGSASTIVVSGDSVNMVSEAVATNKPVYVKMPPNLKSPRLLSFHRRMEEHKFTRRFDGDSVPDIKAFSIAEGNEMPALAKKVKERLKALK